MYVNAEYILESHGHDSEWTA